MSQNNPYLTRISEFPGRLFSDPLDDEDSSSLQNIIRQSMALVVELGSGSGGHLIELAKQDSRTTFIGLELRYKRAYRTLEKSKRLGLNNIFVLRGDGRLFLRTFIPPGSVVRFYVNFPDPWPKRREQKNRVLSPNLLCEIADWLQPDGTLIFRTDQADYFDQVLDIIQAQLPKLRVDEVTRDLIMKPLSIKLSTTEFEHLFLRKGEKINALIATRLPLQQPVPHP